MQVLKALRHPAIIAALIGALALIIAALVQVAFQPDPQSTTPHVTQQTSGDQSPAIVGTQGDVQIVVTPHEGDPEPDWLNILEEELERLPLGKILFNAPGKMKQGALERIEVRILRDPGTELRKALKGRGVPEGESSQVDAVMKVRLTGSAFSISELNEAEQIVPASGFSEWAWDVQPEKSGFRTLHLHVSVRIPLPHGEEKKDHPVIDRHIEVAISPMYITRKAAVTHWKWITASLLVLFIGWIWRNYFKAG